MRVLNGQGALNEGSLSIYVFVLEPFSGLDEWSLDSLKHSILWK